MAVFTSSDRDTVKAAIVTAATEGFATVAIGGQQVTTYTLDQLMNLLRIIQQDLANGNQLAGMRVRQTIPPGCG